MFHRWLQLANPNPNPLKLFESHTSMHNFSKHVSIVTMTQVPAHKGQPNGWNCRTSGRNGEGTGPSQIRKWKRDQSHSARGRWGQGVDVAACKKISLTNSQTGWSRCTADILLLPDNKFLHVTHVIEICVLKPWVTLTITLFYIASFSSKERAVCLELALTCTVRRLASCITVAGGRELHRVGKSRL